MAMERQNSWILGFLLLLSTPGLPAQTPKAVPTQENSQPAETLLIGPGDALHVLVFDTPEMEQHARVTDAGELPLILGGNIKVAGLTPELAARAIEKVLLDGNYFRHPHVSVQVEEFAAQKVFVAGEVNQPGAFDTETPRSVIEVLALAGGLGPLADRKVLIQHRGSAEKIPFYVSNNGETALDSTVKVSPGDTVFVPKAGIAYVLGDVKMAGGYTMTNNEAQLSLLQLVARAGGTNNSAVPSHAKLIRKTASGTVEIAVNLSAMQHGKLADVPLQADDIVYVPFSYLRNSVVNAQGIATSLGSAALYRF
jgi:polysaccharide export outer membrane protein